MRCIEFYLILLKCVVQQSMQLEKQIYLSTILNVNFIRKIMKVV